MYNTRSRTRQQPAPRRRQDVSGYVLYTLLSAIYQKLSRLERPVPVTCALLGINIAAHVLPEAFLPFGVNLVEIGGICLQPSRIVKLMMPPTPSSYGGGGRRSGSSSFFPGLASLLSSLGDVAQGSQGFMTPSSASARWQEAAQRIWLSAIVHGDDAHLYFNMLSLLYKGVSLELAQGSLVRSTFPALSIFRSTAPAPSPTGDANPIHAPPPPTHNRHSPSSPSSPSPGPSPTRSSSRPPSASTP